LGTAKYISSAYFCAHFVLKMFVLFKSRASCDGHAQLPLYTTPGCWLSFANVNKKNVEACMGVLEAGFPECCVDASLREGLEPGDGVSSWDHFFTEAFYHQLEMEK